MDLGKYIQEVETEISNLNEVLLVFRRLAAGQGKRRGRPPAWMSQVNQPKRRGRPPGSKNKKPQGVETPVDQSKIHRAG